MQKKYALSDRQRTQRREAPVCAIGLRITNGMRIAKAKKIQVGKGTRIVSKKHCVGRGEDIAEVVL